MLSSAAALVRDRRNRVLLGRHVVGGGWVIPGGIIDPGETPAQAAAREVAEETGLVVNPTRLLGVWGGTPEHHVTYPNGHEVDYTLVAFEAEVVGGEILSQSEELSDIGWFHLREVADLDVAPWMNDVLAALDDPPRHFRPLSS